MGVMVVRQGVNGWLVMSGADVAEQAATLSESFGNDRFEPADPSVIGALRRTACGWRAQETSLTLAADQQPDEGPSLEPCLRAWAQATQAESDDDAEALLVTSVAVMRLAMEATASRLRQATAASALEERRHRFNHNKFFHAQIELQEELRRRLGLSTERPLKLGIAETLDDPEEFALSVRVRLVLALLRMSELLARGCSGATLPVFDPSSGDDVPISLRPMQAPRWLVSPWCFRESEVALRLPFRAMVHRARPDNTVRFADLPRAPMDVKLVAGA